MIGFGYPINAFNLMIDDLQNPFTNEQASLPKNDVEENADDDSVGDDKKAAGSPKDDSPSESGGDHND